MTVHDRIAIEVQTLYGPHVEHFLVQLRYQVVGGVQLSQIWQLFNSSQVRQLVVRQVYLLEHGQLRDVDWQLGEPHAAEVERLLVASLGVPDFQLNVLHCMFG